MATAIELGGITLDVLSDIKNVHLSVHPPIGRVRIAAPLSMGIGTIRVFVISKFGWIRQQQKKQCEQVRESRYVWGRHVLLNVTYADAAPSVDLSHAKLLLRVRPDAYEATREAILASWFRQLIKTAVPALVKTWEPRLNVTLQRLFVQQMKTKWDSCNPFSGAIRLNTELTKKPMERLEYSLTHKLVHVLVPTHAPRFLALMDRFMPTWRDIRELLNRLPVRHEKWSY